MAAAWIAWTLAAFCAGSIPTGLLIGRARGVDIRRHGSGNIGATNVRRVLGARAGNLCLALDIAKGLLPTLAAGLSTGAALRPRLEAPTAWAWLIVMAAAVLGHMFSPWVRFRGGKGVATGLGGLLGIFPFLTLSALAALLVWIVVVRLTRYVGVASCAAALVLVPAYLLTSRILRRGEDPLPFIAVTAALAALVLWKHRGNLARTLAGTEHRVGEPRPPSENPRHPAP